jgi:hypothetical protein
MHNRLLQLRAMVLFLLLAALGCNDSPTATHNAEVQFRVNAPLCSGGRFGFQFAIDQEMVGSDTLLDKQLSKVYSATPGPHLLGVWRNSARFIPDSAVVLQAGETHVEVVEFYCS